MATSAKIRHENISADENIKDIKEKFKENFNNIKESDLVKNAEEQAKKYAGEAKKALSDYVHENPIAALSIAALAGVGLAFLLSRK